MLTSTFARQWLATLSRASRSYWAIQASIVPLAVLAGAAFFERLQDGEAMPAWGFMLRGALDGLVFVTIAHVLLRPPLRLRYLAGHNRGRDWLLLGLWTGLVALLALGVSYLIDTLELIDVAPVTAIRFEGGGDQLHMQLEGPGLYVVAWLNTFLSYLVWTALYLGAVALGTRRKLQEQVREAKLQQLTLQLNPHFLFNAFNTIRGSIFEDQQRAADLVTQLAELFRFHLSLSNRVSQSLEDEWQLAQKYLAIEQARLDDRLRVEVDLCPSCLGYAVPCLALLGLIENAIKHGVAPDARGGRVQISASDGGEVWHLRVGNSTPSAGSRNGGGAFTGAGAGTGTGLANLRERLDLSYGNRARLDVQRGGDGYVVQLTLPKLSA